MLYSCSKDEAVFPTGAFSSNYQMIPWPSMKILQLNGKSDAYFGGDIVCFEISYP